MATRAERAALDALPGRPLARHIDDFLADLANANKPRNTIRAYRGDLIAFAAHHDGDIDAITAAPVRAFLGEIAGQAPATRKRKRAAVASFCKWAVRHDLLGASPMDRIDTVTVSRTLPRPAPAADIAAVLGAICSRRPRKDVPIDVLRDRVLGREPSSGPAQLTCPNTDTDHSGKSVPYFSLRCSSRAGTGPRSSWP